MGSQLSLEMGGGLVLSVEAGWCVSGLEGRVGKSDNR